MCLYKDTYKSQILGNRSPHPHHIKPCKPILSIMKYGVNRVTLVGNVGDEPRVPEHAGEAFLANFPLATN